MKYIKTLLVSTVATLAVLVCAVQPASALAPAAVFGAQDPSTSKALCEGSGGTWTGTTCGKDGAKSFPQALAQITNLLLFVIGSISVIVIIVGGIRYITSGGDQTGITAAKNTILYAVIGLVVSFLAYAVVNFITGSFK